MRLAQVTVINPPSSIFNTWLFPTAVSKVISRILVFAISIAGLYFFIRVLMAGYSLMSSMGDETKIQNAQHDITNSLFGLLIVVTAFFIMQILDTVLGISIL